eukprot:gene30920-35973_t
MESGSRKPQRQLTLAECLEKKKAKATPTAPSPVPAATTGQTAPNEAMPSAVTPLTAPTGAKPTAATPLTVPYLPHVSAPILPANTHDHGDTPHPPADTTADTALEQESPINNSDTTMHQ